MAPARRKMRGAGNGEDPRRRWRSTVMELEAALLSAPRFEEEVRRWWIWQERKTRRIWIERDAWIGSVWNPRK